MVLYPILLNLEGALCLIVGGGEVARRKINHLLEAGARVRVIAPRVVPQIRAWAREGKLEIVASTYHLRDLDSEARLVFACTDDPDTNKRIAADADTRGIHANCADDPESGGFHVPSMVRRGSLLLTVSTGGKSPALSREICHRLEQQFGPAWGEFTDLLGKLRERWKSRGEAPQIHERMLEIIASDAFEVMQSEGTDAARRHIAALLRRREKSALRRRA